MAIELGLSESTMDNRLELYYEENDGKQGFLVWNDLLTKDVVYRIANKLNLNRNTLIVMVGGTLSTSEQLDREQKHFLKLLFELIS